MYKRPQKKEDFSSRRDRSRSYDCYDGTSTRKKGGHNQPDCSHYGGESEQKSRRVDHHDDDKRGGRYSRDSWPGGEYDEFGRKKRSTGREDNGRAMDADGDDYKPSRERNDRRYAKNDRRHNEADSDDNYEKDTRGRAKELKKKETSEWPPCFDTDPSFFVFDSRSGMFYESLSQYFYDPKSKLYYSNQKGAYYRYDPNEKPPFVEVQKVDPIDSATNTSLVDIDTVAVAANSKPKPSGIRIEIRTKKLKKSSSQSSNKISKGSDATASSAKAAEAVGVAVPKVKQMQIANMEKWSERQAELQKLGASNAPHNAQSVSTEPKVRTTTKGEPICVICKRKFPTIEKLELHEKSSQLHRQNLERLQEAEKVAAEKKRKAVVESTGASRGSIGESALGYVDRAQKRRLMHHGTDVLTVKDAVFRHHHQRNRDSGIPMPMSPAASTAPAESLNSNNVGHKMLQKMGWKPADSETKKSDDPSSAVAPSSTADRLRQDWDRIEALARNFGRR